MSEGTTEARRPGHTIGVAVPVPAPHGAYLDAARAGYEGVAPDMPAHVTILAPVDVDADALPAVEAHLGSVAARTRPFRLILRGTGTFQPVSPVVFIAVADGISACEQLEREVRSGDLAVDSRFPYHPHVTVVHDAPTDVLDRAFADLADFRADMTVDAIALYEHRDDSWHLVREFALGGA